ncbi:MAG: excinuclease ABC subunit UvrC [Spirochaetota bacterium]
MREKLEKSISTLPNQPGVYLMKNSDEDIIYIGKAGLLKKRVSSYFQKSDQDIKTRILVKNIHDIDYIVTDSDIEALLLENTLIKKHKPRYNVRLKDDKRYPYITVTLHEKYPRVMYTRKLMHNGDRYFGPYTDAKAARETVILINKIFKLKTCKKDIPLPPGERPCLNYQMGMCQGVCQGEVTRQEYREVIDNVIYFLEGEINPVIENLQSLMKNYSANYQYEKAARIRDMIFNIQSVSEAQNVVTPIGKDEDYIDIAGTGKEALVLLFEFRKGVMTGKKISVFDNIDYSSPSEILSYFLIDYYRRSDIPARIITPLKLHDRPMIQRYLHSRSGGDIQISAPKASREQKIASLLKKNLDMLRASHDIENDDNRNSAILFELQQALNLPHIPDHIECVDISNIQGTHPVASMVHFTHGQPDKKEYRRYKIRSFTTANDPGMIHEVVGRRLQYLANESAPLPRLLVIDGGRAQLSRAIEAMEALDITIPVISLAKRFEEIYTHPSGEPIRLPETSEALKLLKRVRDEAHRFAITYHKKIRGSAATRSILDDIPGIGKSTRTRILSNIDDPAKLKVMSIQEIADLPGIGQKTAEKIYNHFH